MNSLPSWQRWPTDYPHAYTTCDRLKEYVSGSAIVCIAGGPSVQEQLPLLSLARLRGLFCIGVNYSAIHLGWTQAATFYDSEHITEQTYRSYGGLLFAPMTKQISVEPDPYNFIRVPVRTKPVGVPWDFDSGLFNNSGGAGLAISLAYALNAGRIILVGYEYTSAEFMHWYGGQSYHRGAFEGAVDMMEELGAMCDDRIVNCSGITALKNFKRGDLKTELEATYEWNRKPK